MPGCGWKRPAAMPATAVWSSRTTRALRWRSAHGSATFFRTQNEARAFAGQLEKVDKARSKSVATVKPSQLRDALQALEILEPTGACLVEAARDFTHRWQLRNTSVTSGTIPATDSERRQIHPPVRPQMLGSFPMARASVAASVWVWRRFKGTDDFLRLTKISVTR
jgi:hypothetical protein